MSNSDYTVISEEQREKIIKYTGIRFRRWAPKELCCSDLCQAAAEKLITENVFAYTPFRKFGAESELKFGDVP